MTVNPIGDSRAWHGAWMNIYTALYRHTAHPLFFAHDGGFIGRVHVVVPPWSLLDRSPPPRDAHRRSSFLTTGE
jgi:hypothetical protein